VSLPIWVMASFWTASLLIGGIVRLLELAHVPIQSVNENVLSAVLAAVLYVVTLCIVIGVPWVLKRYKVSRADVGLTHLPTWTDIWMTPVGLIVYLIASSLILYAATTYVPGFDSNQAQDTGFNQLSQQYEYVLAFITLVIVAPIAEELLFRGYLFGKLKKFFPLWIAILVTSVLFAALHGAWNLALDTFALSIVMCLLRVSTGSLWAPIMLHMTKNGIAFYILFINPVLLNTLGG
jgi:uncharacterized protein